MAESIRSLSVIAVHLSITNSVGRVASIPIQITRSLPSSPALGPTRKSWWRRAGRPAMVSSARGAPQLCAGHVQQFGGESPLANLMEVKA
jgi:hypothetical protein